jgi:CRP/FNR family cyclic AMP-dependent transcriptional regulator
VRTLSVRTFLRSLSFFAGLSDEDLDKVASITRERRYRKGTVIFREGDPGDFVYFVKEGKVRVSRLGAGGQEQVLRVWEPGAPVGLVVLADRAPYPATAQAAEDAVLVVIRVDDLLALLPECRTLATNVLCVVAERLRLAQDRAHNLAVHTTHGRLASLLLRLAAEKGSYRFRLGLTHQDLAGMIGTSRETVSRAMADFRRTGCIQTDGDYLTILDEEKLLEWMEG